MIRRLSIALALCAPASAQLAHVEGRVVDAAGKPVAAKIALAEVGRGTVLVPNAVEMLVVTPGESGAIRKRCSRELSAGADGRFAIQDLQPGTYGFVAADTERGFSIREVVIAMTGNAPLEIALEPPRFLDVKVRGLAFDPTKHVLEVRTVRTFGNVNVLPRLAQDGWSFRAGPLPAVDEWLVLGTELVLDHDYRATLFEQTVAARPEGASAGGPDGPSLIHPLDGERVVGTVRGPDRKPLAGVSVVARSLALPHAWARGAVTDSGGNFSLHLVEPNHDTDTYTLEARRWVLREMAGCGNGPVDVLARREFTRPSIGDDAVRVDLSVEHLDEALALGAAAPDFEATTLDGAKLKLSDLRGKVVLVDFWATWCAMCRAEMPALEKFYADRAAKGFEVVAISIDDEASLVRRFLASRKLPWKVIALGPPKSNPLAQLFNVWGTPATFVLDRESKIVARNLLGEDLRKAIDAQLAAK
jgi:peroxiredoxin